jgi:hypothetical protein
MFGNLGKMMKLASEMKTKLPELQQRLAESEYTAEAGGGAVSATVNGKGQLLDVHIGAAAAAGEQMDAAALADMVKAAVSAAQERAAAAAREAMAELTGGVEIPGLTDMM